jgi:GNAT superfamily N-acetyltransferase
MGPTGRDPRREIMEIEIANLTEETLGDLPEWESPPFSCKYCTYWEFLEHGVDAATETKDEAMRRKADWLRSASALFGNCGRIAYVDGAAAGYAQYAPPALLPQAANYPAGPPSTGTVLLSCLFVPQHRFRGLGLGTQLLESILTELRQRGIGAVETFARKGRADNPSGPVAFYLGQGFRIHRDDAEFPLLHLDL